MRTCNLCEEKKPENQFYKGHVCSRCWCNRANNRTKSLNAISLDSARNHRKPWGKADLELLNSLVSLDTPKLEIAVILGRSLSSIYTQSKKESS